MPEQPTGNYEYLEFVFAEGVNLEGCFLRCVGNEPVHAFVSSLEKVFGDDEHYSFRLQSGPGVRRDFIVVTPGDKVSCFAPTRKQN